MKKLIVTTCALILSISLMQAQKNEETKTENSKKEKLHVKIKDGAKPDIYVDGKKFDFPMELLDKNKIESVSVLKGDKAIKEYNAKNGVILITTKKPDEVTIENGKVTVKGYAIKGKAPMIIIDGKQSSQKKLKKLTTYDIESIEVLKDKQALKKHNAPNGVIIVKTTKEKKE